MRRLFLFLALLWGGLAYGQATQIASGPVEPATCDPTVGQLFFNNSTVPAILKQCSGTNTWAAITGGTGGTSFPWTTLSSTGTPSLSVTNGSANYFMSVTSNVTGVTISGVPTNGEYIGIDFKEDATGGRTIPLSSFPGNFIFPTGCSFTTTANANNWLAWTYDGTNWQPVPGSCVPLATTLALKPATSDNICYVSVNGNDSNDGLSIGSAKLTPYSCLTTVLPSGNSTTAGNGTIMLSGAISNFGGPVSNQGFWIMGPNDPNFASPPSGWLKVNNGTPTAAITFDCFSKYFAVTNGHTGTCSLQIGSAASSLPSIWISSVGGNITFNNVQFIGGIGNYARIGIDSNNARTANSGSSGIAFNNVAMANGTCTNTGQTGPTIDIGGTSFWIWMDGNTFGGCPPKIFTVAASGAVRSGNVTTITTTAANDISTGELDTITNVTDDSFNGSFVVTKVDSTHFTYANVGPNTTSGTGQVVTPRAAAINLDPGSLGSLVGLVFIDKTNLNGGNIRYVNGTNGGGFYVKKLSYEGNFVSPDAPVVLITGTSSTSNGDSTNIHVEDLEIADAAINIPGVQVDNPGGLFPDLVIVSRIAGYTRGRMTVLGNASISLGSDNATYIRKQQYGLRNGQITATGIDEARRLFGPVAAKGTNIASTLPSGWSFNQGTGTITSNIAAPDGTTNAGRVAYSTGSPGATVQFYSSSTALNIGDIYIYGVWARSFTTNGYVGSQPPLIFAFTSGGHGVGDGCQAAQGSPPGVGVVFGNFAGSVQNDGQWQWYSGLCKVVANASTPGTFFGAQVDSTHTTEFYAPTLALFSSGTISDNEAYEIALNMAPWPSTASTGDISLLPNQPLRIGSTTFANLGTPNNGDLEFCTDCTAISNPCVGGGTGAFAQRIAGAWVCGNSGGCPPAGLTDAIQYNGGGPCNFAGLNPPITNGNYLVNYHVIANAAVPPTANLPGVPINAQTGTTYTEGSANTDSDRGYLTTASNSSAQTYTMVNPSSAGFGFNYFNVLHNINTGAVTENASGFTVNGGASLLVPPNYLRWLWSDGVNYRAAVVPSIAAFVDCNGAGKAEQFTAATGVWTCGTSSAGVSSLTGDGALITNSASTGAVTLTLGTALAHKVWMNNTGATATPGYQSIGTADLPAVTVFNNQANTYTGGGLQDFSAMVWKIPTSAGFTAGATTMFGYDSTNKNPHIYDNNADAIVCAFASTPTTGDLVSVTVASSQVLCSDAGFLASNVVRKDAANTGAAAMTLDMSASTGATAFKVPVIAGATAGADGVIDYDSTNKNTHIRANGADAIAGAFASAPTTGDCVNATVSSGNVLLTDFGQGCAVKNPPFDKSSTGLSNPTADATFTQPATSTTGWTLAGTAPASVSTSTGTTATTLFNVNGVAGGATSNATGTGGVGSSPTMAGGTGGAGTGTNAVGGAGGTLTWTAGNGGASNGTGANSNGGNIVATPGSAGSGGSGAAGHAGVFQIGTAECTVPGTAGGLCVGEGTEPTNVSGAATLIADSGTHEWMGTMNGASTSTPGMMVRSQPSPINQTGKTGAITTATLCAASAGACNQVGQYHVHFNFWGSGTACSNVAAGSVNFQLTWTDENSTAHSAVIIPVLSQTGATSIAQGNSFLFQTALANESASGDITISTNGSVIQYATGYTACTTGTGTYNLRAAVTRVQ